MRKTAAVRFGIVFTLAALAACGGSGGGDSQPTALSWYTTCGDPVCAGYRGPFPGVPLCSTEKAGDACTVASAECDPKDVCNARLRCTDKDPRQQTGGCPISRAAFKLDIRYLDDGQRMRLNQEVQALKLATYHYRDAGPAGALRLGFLLDDVKRNGGQLAVLAVDAERDQVDLYSYVSTVVAALQVQAQQIEGLRAEIQQLRQVIAERDLAPGKARKASP